MPVTTLPPSKNDTKWILRSLTRGICNAPKTDDPSIVTGVLAGSNIAQLIAKMKQALPVLDLYTIISNNIQKIGEIKNAVEQFKILSGQLGTNDKAKQLDTQKTSLETQCKEIQARLIQELKTRFSQSKSIVKTLEAEAKSKFPEYEQSNDAQKKALLNKLREEKTNINQTYSAIQNLNNECNKNIADLKSETNRMRNVDKSVKQITETLPSHVRPAITPIAPETFTHG